MSSALRYCCHGLWAMATATSVCYAVLHYNSHSKNDDEAAGARTRWLQLHNPAQAHHDAEMLRRRKLVALIETEDESELDHHATSIVWSLENEDEHVRHLALGLLSRLQNASITANAPLLAEHLGSPDDRVRLGVVKALTRLTPEAIAPLASDLVEMIADSEPAVRWAALEALNLLPAAALATVTRTAIDRLIEQQELSLAQEAIGSWSQKLDPDSEAHGAVLNAMGHLGMLQSSASTAHMGERPPVEE